jgi:hypothetical protein
MLGPLGYAKPGCPNDASKLSVNISQWAPAASTCRETPVIRLAIDSITRAPVVKHVYV